MDVLVPVVEWSACWSLREAKDMAVVEMRKEEYQGLRPSTSPVPKAVLSVTISPPALLRR